MQNDIRALKQEQELAEERLRQLSGEKRLVESGLDKAREKATRLRRVKETNDKEIRELEQEVKALNGVCEARQVANESLGRELTQMMEDDELIRQRLDRASRIQNLKAENQRNITQSWVQVEKSKSPIRRERHHI